ncbi:DUF3644 domain-containing protein [Legionella longbeachae]|uniref:DUF3644 domain-containing protein n=1 Tax=Legionella longbeachae TaxID=450 RepID=UPI0001BEB8F6|nr:DUF3644 domain-containing protein [Legionella longbeachae]EEZ93447.1 conserved hypothetical protein [Legionella longbeachae D-4968]
MKNASKIKLLNLLSELKSFEEHKTEFTFGDISTPYANSTLRKYLTTYLDGYCISTKKNYWACSGIKDLTSGQYLKLMSQKNNYRENDEIQRIQQRSKEAFLTCLAIYNNPSLKYRLESFLILLINAWELLLKFELSITKGKNSILRKDGLTLSITECINRIFKENDFIRINLEWAIKLRDQATHLIIPETYPNFTRLLYPTTQNYMKKYQSLVNESPLGNSKGMINIIVDDPEANLIQIKQKYGDRIKDEIEEFILKLDKKANELKSNSFFIAFEYNFTLVQKDHRADLALTKGEEGNSTKIIDKPVSIQKKYPFKTTEFIDHINKNVKNKINKHCLYSINYEYNIKNKPEYFLLNENVPRYSQQFADWFIYQHTKDKCWLENAKLHFSRAKKNLNLSPN